MKQLVLVIGAVLVAAIAVVGFVYAFGVPQQGDGAGSPASPPAAAAPLPDAESASENPAPSSAAQPEAVDEQQAAKVPADAVAPPADPSVPLAIEIPGCVCHSKDPRLVKEHAAYRMNQCAGCHVGGVPTGQ
jgi:hypothetical protein